MVFAEDHWESYADPLLALHLVQDDGGTPFLLLAGPEPDVQWERFVRAVSLLVDDLGVGLTVGLNAIPMAVPHTRPLGIIAHAARPEMVAGHARWVGTVQVPSTAGHLLEYRLGQAGLDAAGFAVAVPHYLAEAEYAPAALALLGVVADLSGLTFTTDALEASADQVRGQVDQTVGGSDEVRGVVEALERQYDAYLAGAGRSLLAQMGGSLPTAEEIGDELEAFLAEQAEDGST